MGMIQVDRKTTNPPYKMQISALSTVTWDLNVGQFRFHGINRIGNIVDSKLNRMFASYRRGKVVGRRNGHRILVVGEVIKNITRDS